MGLLDKIFGGKKQTAVVDTTPAECPHSVLVPRWDSVQDMGIEDKVTRFMCESCKEMFAPDEARHLRDTLTERVARIEAERNAEGGGSGAS